MTKLPSVVPITDLRQDAASVLKRVRASGEPLVITQRGRASAVLLSLEAYEAGEERRGLLEALARGERDLQAGRLVPLEDVLARADRILEREPSKRGRKSAR